MENTYESSTIEMDREGFSELSQKISQNKGQKVNEDGDIRDKKPEVKESAKESPASKKYTLKKGEQSLELDDDFEIEMTADKKPVRMTLKELKDRAAGDVAVKNRMHSLAEEKKKVQATFKEFASMAKKDPLAALEFISGKAKEADSEFEYDKYIEKLAEQAEKLGQMDEKDRKAWELEKKLSKAEEDLSRKQRTETVVLRKQEMLSEYPEIGDSEFGQMVDAVLGNEDLIESLEDEMDVMDKVEELIQETLTQRDIMSVIQEINPSYLNNNELIFTLSDQLRLNPDLDEQDVRDIVRDIIGGKSEAASQRNKDIKTLSTKQRQSMPVERIRERNSDPYQLLHQQLMEKREEIKKTPLNKR